MIAGVNVGLTVAATLLGEEPFCFETVMEPGTNRNGVNEDGTVREASFVSPYQIVVRAPVKLEMEDRLWMGHVVACRPEGAQWRTSVQIEHQLRGLPQLLELVQRFE